MFFCNTVAEMLETQAAAVSTLRRYIEDSSTELEFVMRDAITTQHMGYLSFLVRSLPPEGEVRASGGAGSWA